MWSAAHVTIPDYTALIAPDCTLWHGMPVYSRAVTHVRILTAIFMPSVYRISTIKLAVNNEDGSN